MKKIYPSSNEIEKLADRLAEKIIKSKEKFDIILGISRGGLFPGIYLSDRLSLPLAVISCSAYKKGTKESRDIKEIKISDGISTLSPLEGKVLLVDDLVDSGGTMKKLYKKLRNQDKNTKTAVLYIKPWSKFKPDYYIKTTDAWVIFPYQKKEYKDLK